MPERRLRVLDPGLLSSVQDLGRPGASQLAIPTGGAADARSLRALNALLLNAPNTACIEVTLTGAAFAFDGAAAFALMGAPADAHIEHADGTRMPIPRATVCAAHPGDTLRMAHTRSGARLYLGVAGGIDTPIAIGSRSTHTASGFPIPALQAGDGVPIGTPRNTPAIGSAIPPELLSREDAAVFRTSLRVTPGPHADMFPPGFLARLAETKFTASSESSRAGVRLRCETPIPAPSSSLLTEPMSIGFVQVPPSGQPIILGRDHPTTGGYPVLASVITADLDAIGQLRPGQPVNFEIVTSDEARSAWIAARSLSL